MIKMISFFILLSVYSIHCWEALPQIPTGRRSQYLVLHENEGYKYGYDTGDGSAAEQSGDSSNQVEGRYLYDGPAGQKVSLKYTAGVQGFVPEGIPTVSPSTYIAPPIPVLTQYSQNQRSTDDEAGTGDASYSFSIDSDTYRRQEASDARGNIKGSFSYNNEAGTHDLAYIAGENTGFVATSGSLAIPNGLEGHSSVSSSRGYPYNQPAVGGSNVLSSSPVSNTLNPDGSYSFGYSTADATQQQSGDANGNVKGSFSYRNPAGAHDLSYIAGTETGFVVTGGSLSQPNGLGGQVTNSASNSPTSVSSRNLDSSVLSPLSTEDGSYRFEYSTDDSSRQEVGNANGNVKGSYSYRNPVGTHDLSYIAGSETGFVVTGGSLSQPNGLGAQEPNSASSSPTSFSSRNLDSSVLSPLSTADGSYKFEYSTDDSSRQEVSDANGNVQGSYSYRNQAGDHDLNYIAGSSSGFQVTGGSLSVPNGLISNANSPTPTFYNTPKVTAPLSTYSAQQQTDLANTGDSSYSFTIDTDDYKRVETSDANGNVQGSFSYRNPAGTHDLKFVAGSATGFQSTGGSLFNLKNVASNPGLTSRSSLALPSTASNSEDNENTGNASYNFSIDTDEYKRTESSDANGNVVGSFSYRNPIGQHDLSYEAGAEKGFRATGGSLSIPPGLAEPQLRSGGYTPQISYSTSLANSYSGGNTALSSSKSTYRIGNVVVNSYLPPSNEKKKFGYIFDTKY